MKWFLIVIGLILALVAILVPCIPVSASPRQSNAPFVRIKRSTSSNWSGYAETTTAVTGGTPPITGTVGSVTNASGQWTVPAITGPSGRGAYYSSAWVGIDGYGDTTVEQIGTEQDWSNGRPSYYAWFEMYPSVGYELNTRVFPVAAGDVMTATVVCTNISTGAFTLSLSDVTKGWSFSPANYPQYAKQTLKSAKEESAEWVMEAPSSSRGVLPLADFKTINFSNCSAIINGASCGITTTGAYDPITMETSTGMPEATPSGLTPTSSSGVPQAFSVNWGSSGATNNITNSYQHVHLR